MIGILNLKKSYAKEVLANLYCYKLESVPSVSPYKNRLLVNND